MGRLQLHKVSFINIKSRLVTWFIAFHKSDKKAPRKYRKALQLAKKEKGLGNRYKAPQLIITVLFWQIFNNYEKQQEKKSLK
jgi:hypothetical protein